MHERAKPRLQGQEEGSGMSWHQGPMVLADLETTGVDPFRDRIVTAAVIEVGGGRESRTHTWTLDPGIEIPEGATAVHGITTEEAREYGADAASGVWEIVETLLRGVATGAPVVGHNIGGFDFSMLWAESVRHGHREHVTQLEDIATGEAGHVVDTMVLEKHLDAFRPGSPETNRGRRPDSAVGTHNLIDCCRLWDIPLTEEDAHGAVADALASGRLAWRLATDPLRFEQYDFKPTARINPAMFTLPALHAWQQQTYATEAARFQSYRRGEQRRQPKEGADPNFTVSTAWPLQNPPADWSPDQVPAPREEAIA